MATALVYDDMGRLTGTRPAGGAWTENLYQLPTTAEPALVPRLTVRQCANSTTGCAGSELTWQRLSAVV